MSAYIRCPKCLNDELDVDTFRCDTCGPFDLVRAEELQRLTQENAEHKLANNDLHAALAKATKFKTYTHGRLDSHGVPHHPPGPHGAKGCRIGDRMDWLMERVQRLSAGLTCFSCNATYTLANAAEPCEQAHCETWGHEWVSPRVLKLTTALFEVNQQRDRLAGEVERLSLTIVAAQGGGKRLAAAYAAERAARGELASKVIEVVESEIVRYGQREEQLLAMRDKHGERVEDAAKIEHCCALALDHLRGLLRNALSRHAPAAAGGEQQKAGDNG